MSFEATDRLVLTELVRLMGPDKLVVYDHRIVQALHDAGVGSGMADDALERLEATDRLEKLGDALYRVTIAGENTVPVVQTDSAAPRRRTMAEKAADQQQ